MMLQYGRCKARLMLRCEVCWSIDRFLPGRFARLDREVVWKRVDISEKLFVKL